MLPDRVSNPGPLTYKSGALATALRGPALRLLSNQKCDNYNDSLSSAFSALHIQNRMQIFSEHASKLCVIAAASLMGKT